MKSPGSRKIRQFIQEQTQTNRYILLLHYTDDLTTDEIGLVLDMSEPAVRKQLGSLQQQIQQQLLLTQASNHTQSSLLGFTGSA